MTRILEETVVIGKTEIVSVNRCLSDADLSGVDMHC